MQANVQPADHHILMLLLCASQNHLPQQSELNNDNCKHKLFTLNIMTHFKCRRYATLRVIEPLNTTDCYVMMVLGEGSNHHHKKLGLFILNYNGMIFCTVSNYKVLSCSCPIHCSTHQYYMYSLGDSSTTHIRCLGIFQTKRQGIPEGTVGYRLGLLHPCRPRGR